VVTIADGGSDERRTYVGESERWCDVRGGKRESSNIKD